MPDGTEKFFRSTWEYNVALYLIWLQEQGKITKWEYEVDEYEFPVKRGNRFYKPDFKVWVKDQFFYIEVKGYMDNDSRVKLKRMAKYYPDIRVKLFMKEEYDTIKLKFSHVLEGWEFG